ncbi:hypothetical protein [Cellulomonas sp. ES6]|uniref:hypothetical protein n=1 Tax=Cellulomonas sp. ES6 TaxID=3039384 RepID=UPI0024B65440|nr:hypothetical protein [Cellulomonas sp. ES6]WHP16258.1 hypothetical protein P9841_11475 [Cellulomonas sp. ES6]
MSRARAGRRARPAPRRPRAATLLVAALALAVGGLGAVGATVAPTGAALRDVAGLDATVGSGERFDIGLVQDGVLRQAEGDGVAWQVDGAGSLLPGHTVTFDVPVANNGPYDADVVLAVADRYAETAPSGPGSDPVALYRWSVADAQTGAVLAGTPATPLTSTVTTAQVGAAVGGLHLAGRTLPAVADGAPWTADPAAPGDHRVLRVTVAYPDTPATEAFNGGRSALALVFTGSSR